MGVRNSPGEISNGVKITAMKGYTTYLTSIKAYTTSTRDAVAKPVVLLDIFYTEIGKNPWF